MLAALRRALVAMVEARGTAAFLAASLVVGVLVGLGAVVLVVAIEAVTRVAVSLRQALPWGLWGVLLTIPLGITASWLIDRRFGPGIEGGGVSETLVGISMRAGYLPTRSIGAKLAATAATLGAGGSAGREGPIVQIGAAIGSSFARYTRFGEDQIRSLVAAGAGAGIGAAFNAPIAGMLFAMEVILGNFALRHINAVVVASVAASVTARELLGEEAILSSPSHSLGHPAELAIYVALGVLAAGAGLAYVWAADHIEPLSRRLRGVLRPLAGGLVVALLVMVEPTALGTGQAFLSAVLRLVDTSSIAWYAFLGIAAVKLLAATTTNNTGGSGGSMMPSLVIGGCLGAALALAVAPVWGLSDLNIGAFAVVGMAATFAATGKAPLTSIIIVFEITGDYNLVLPLMLASSLATFVYDRFQSESDYTLPLVRRGIHLQRTEDIDLLDTVQVGEVMTPPGTVLDPANLALEAAAALEAERHHGAAVVRDGRLVGIATATDLAAARQDPSLSVGDVMTTSVITVEPRMAVSAALARMASLGIGRLPVVAEGSRDRLVGMFRRESVVHAYHEALAGTTDRAMYRERLRARRQPGAGFFELPIPARSPVHGKAVREVTWPEEVTLVSVRRDDRVIIPQGDTVLMSGDTVTAFGTSEARLEVAHVLEHGA